MEIWIKITKLDRVNEIDKFKCKEVLDLLRHYAEQNDMKERSVSQSRYESKTIFK